MNRNLWKAGCVLITIVFWAVPAMGQSDSRSGITGGNGAVIVGPEAPPKQTTVVTYTAVTPPRQWTDLKGRQMIARLLAFSAPAEGEKGPVIVIHNERVRFLKPQAKEPIEFPLKQLSKDDQVFIQDLAALAEKGPPPKKEESKEKEAPGQR